MSLGRNRKKSNQQLPKGVYINRGRYVYIARVDGVQQKAIVIGKSNMLLPDLWQAYRELTESSTNTLRYIIDQYKAGDKFKSLKTRRDIGQKLDNLMQSIVSGVEFGSVKYEQITPGVIRKYLDWRNNVSGNREISYLSAAWSWCYERDIVTTPNPCKGVRKLKENHRTRLVTQSEYKAVYDIAPKAYQVAMELAYLCRMRRSEVLDTRVKDITPEGLDTRRLKGSKDAITLWSDRLRDAVDRGLEGKMRVPEMPIVSTDKGRKIRATTFTKGFSRLVSAANVKHYTFHDLKAMGVSNYTGNKQDAGGWKDPNMVKTYDRAKLKAKATE